MALYTPHGLKIRLDPDAVNEVIEPLSLRHDMNDILLDVELWENLPEGVAALAASATAFFTQSAGLTIAAALGAYIVGSFIRGFTYSDLLRRLFPSFLGAPVLTAIHTIAIAVFLGVRHQYLAAGVLSVVNIAAHGGLLGLIELPLMSIRVPLRKALGLEPTHQEGVFIAICNRRARKYGIDLDWDKYTKRS
jgi:hypothetical protein